MAKVYFVTGKGGTGKSTLARALAKKLSSHKKKVLLLKIDSFSLSHAGDRHAHHVSENLWEQKLQLHAVAEEYFRTTLAKIPIPGAFQKFASRLQEGIAQKVLNNKFVLRFIEACPGLTPTIFLGKVCREGREGGPNKSDGAWGAVVVDAPSTGQALQVFDSSKTLSRVLTQGPISNHIVQTLNFAYSPEFEIHVMTLPEEGPLQECLETLEKFRKLDLKVKQIWINKVTPDTELLRLQSLKSHKDEVQRAVATEIERILDQESALETFAKEVGGVKLTRIPEHLHGEKIPEELLV